MHTIRSGSKPLYLPLCLSLLFYILLRYVFLLGYVPTGSMEPTLPKDSFIFGVRLFDKPQIGDIIVFKKDNTLLVKRVAACPGDTIDLSKLQYMTNVPLPVWDNPIITAPDGYYFVLGDNTQDSWDSRYWNEPFISEDTIVAKLVLVDNPISSAQFPSIAHFVPE